jgi:hypothetical protein
MKLKKEMFITDNIVKKELDLIIIYQDQFRHLTINIKKLLKALISQDLMIQVFLHQNGISKI